MIQTALNFTKKCLEQNLRNQFGLNESKVVLNNLVDTDGKVDAKNNNKLVISLINLEHETAKPYYDRYQRIPDGSWSDVNPSVRLNMDVLLASVFDDYQESLKFLNASISFLQAHTTLSSHYYSDVPKGIEKLEFEIAKINYFDMHSLWSAMGAKYLPSILYKVRMITIQSNQQLKKIRPVQSVSESIAP